MRNLLIFPWLRPIVLNGMKEKPLSQRFGVNATHEHLGAPPSNNLRKLIQDPPPRTAKRERRRTSRSSKDSHQIEHSAHLDITMPMGQMGLSVSAVMSPRLWNALAKGDAFDSHDSRLLLLCWQLVAALAQAAHAPDLHGPLSQPVLYDAEVEGRVVQVLAVACWNHGTNSPLLRLLCPEEGKSFGREMAGKHKKHDR